MQIKDLIKELKQFKPTDQIYIANDIEGNQIKTIHAICITKDGDFEDCDKDAPGAERINGEYVRWVPTKDLITIYPSDEVANE